MTTQASTDPAGAAPYRRTQAVGRTVQHLGALFTWLARAEDTGGAFSLIDVHARQGTEPPPHTHTYEDEAFFVIDGELTVRVSGETMRLSAGDFAFLPRGHQHHFTIGSEQAHWLVLITPAGLETTFDAFSEPAEDLTLPTPQGPPPAELMAELDEKFAAAGVRIAG